MSKICRSRREDGIRKRSHRATSTPEAVTLASTAPQNSVTGDVAPLVPGYNIYRHAPGSAPGDLATPIDTAPIKGTTYTYAPEYGEHEFRVVAVAAAGPPSLQ